MSNPRGSQEGGGDVVYSLAEAAAILRVSPDWLGRACARGDVPSRKIGHFRRLTPADIEEYLESVREGRPASIAGTTASQRRRRTA